MIAGDTAGREAGARGGGHPGRVDPAGRAVLRLGRWDYALRAPAEREATYLYERLAGARLTGTGRRATLELEHRDGSALTCTATAAAALREAAPDGLEGLLPPGSGAPPRV